MVPPRPAASTHSGALPDYLEKIYLTQREVAAHLRLSEGTLERHRVAGPARPSLNSGAGSCTDARTLSAGRKLAPTKAHPKLMCGHKTFRCRGSSQVA